MANSSMEIDQRVNVSLAFKSYLRAQRQYNAAARRFNESCTELRKHLEPHLRAVIRADEGHYLLMVDPSCEFDIQPIDTIYERQTHRQPQVP
ncbi:MAG: hypothetical protein ACPGLY_27245, partial [Rubripirellula sp.]